MTLATTLDSAPRQQWMALLAKAPVARLDELVQACGELPSYSFLRSPEIGLTMVRGRMGGTGQPFNLGEMTLTRCVVQIPDGRGGAIAGFGYVAGRSHRHADLAARCAALLQHPEWGDRLQLAVLQPLQAEAQAARATLAQQTEATRVNFLTLLRGEAG